MEHGGAPECTGGAEYLVILGCDTPRLGGMSVAEGRCMKKYLRSLAALSVLGAYAAAGCAASDDPGSADLSTSEIGKRFAFKVGAERTASYSIDNAYWMAMLSGAAYVDQAFLAGTLALGAEINVQAPGYELKAFDVYPSSQAFYLGTPDAGFLVFRGSSDETDWNVTNKDATPRKDFAPGALVHTGFARSAENLWDSGTGTDGKAKGGIGAFLRARHGKQNPKAKPLYVGGHSLGGALAILVSQLALFDGCRKDPAWAKQATAKENEACRADYIPIAALYTYGQPVVGDAGFAKLFGGRLPITKTKYVRIVNMTDVVAKAPPGYGHVDGETKGGFATLVGLSRQGALLPNQDPSLTPDDRKVKPVGEVCEEKAQGILDHTLQTYINKIRESADGTKWVRKACE
jgi:Lipase (class 3)